MSATMTAPVPLPPAAPAPACAVIVDERVYVPPGIDSLASFRTWAHSDEFPEIGRIAWLNGTLWLDLTMEQAYTHNGVKLEIARVLSSLSRITQDGCYFVDGMRLSHPGTNLSTDPDGMFIRFAAFQGGQIRQVPGVHGGVVEFEGTPDMVLEVVSDSSVEKDNVLLPPLYLAAGIAEFWRIDARGDLRFEVLRHTAAGYASTQLPDGWWRSSVFQRDFRLTPGADALGQPQFTLEHRV
jgi:Uma2 family endonuclease